LGENLFSVRDKEGGKRIRENRGKRILYLYLDVKKKKKKKKKPIKTGEWWDGRASIDVPLPADGKRAFN